LDGRELTEAEIDALHEEHLLQVELVQLEQAALLRCLAKHHGLRRLLAEGMTAEDVPLYPKRIAELCETELCEAGKHLPAIHEQLAEVRPLLASMSAAGREQTQRYAKAKAVERELLGLLQQHRLDVLRFGAVGRLFAAGEVEGVLPLDDAQLLDAARPITAKGNVKGDPEKIRAREDAQVQAALKSGPVAVIVLGGAHDLAESVRRAANGKVEYLRVSTRRFQQVEVQGALP